MAVGRRIAAVGRRAVRRTTAAVSPLAVALATFALAAFALAALVNELDIGWWPWWVVAGVVALASAGPWWVLPFVGFLALNLAAAFALAALVNELDIGWWPWWVVASVVAVASTGWSWSVQVAFAWLWNRRERTRERARGSGYDDVIGDVLPRKSTPLIATVVGLFAGSAGVVGISTSLNDSSPGAILTYVILVGLGVLSFVMGLMLARYRSKHLAVIRQHFVNRIESGLKSDEPVFMHNIYYFQRQRDVRIDNGDFPDAKDMSFQIRELILHRNAVKRRRTPPQAAPPTRPPNGPL